MTLLAESNHDGMRAGIWLGYRDLPEWFHVCQCLMEGCASSPIWFNISNDGSQRFAMGPTIYPLRLGKSRWCIGRLMMVIPGKRHSERVQRAVWGVPYEDDEGIAAKSPYGLARRMAVIVVVVGQEPRLSVSEKKTGHTSVLRSQLLRDRTAQPGSRPMVQAHG